MTTHRLFNAALFVLALIAWLFVMDSDHTAEQAMDAERREWMQAIQFCHRTAGPQTAPEIDDRGVLVCTGKRGQRHNEVKVANK